MRRRPHFDGVGAAPAAPVIRGAATWDRTAL